ncbi:phage tail spike protein [Halalkalibacterium halodurans]|uniref:phage tail spike protein n=1 Tax=Halalkalibacterium halodurans TaxID=86665 RepID=UPI002AA97DA2|nr:phage tail spike protein [Halalkalibacterium halodurans]MDY7222092.1 phage tail spike protein [Halalkalibacterium halodurans]MDY7243889.1 phage tail spike protein [Halalkalibacterium halodurans]
MTTPIPQIHVADGQSDRVLDVITDRWIIEDEHRQSLEDTLETFNFTTFGDQRFSQWLEKRNRLIIPNEDGQFVEFIIQESVKIHDENGLSIEVYSSASYLDLKKAKVIEPQTLSEMTALAAANNAISGTEWQVGVAEASGFRTFHIDKHTNPYAFLKQIANEFELELRFRVETDRHKITRRYVDLVKRIGEWKGREVEFGKDLQGVRRFERNENIVTALLGLGPEPTEEGENRLEIWVEDDDALQRWGRNGKHLVDHYEPSFTDEEPTLQRLKVLTENELEKRINSAIEYEVDVADIENFAGIEGHAIRFGDTIKIKDTAFNPPLYVEARVFEQSRSIVDPTQKTIKLGDFREFTEEEVMAIWKQLQLEIQNKISLAELFNHTYSKPQIDQKDETVYEEGTVYTDERSNQVKQEASQDATEKANQAEQNSKQYTDDVAIVIEQRTNEFVVEYAEKKVAQGASPPSNPSVGDLWIDVSQDPHVWKRWNGSQWEALERTDLSQLQGQIQSDQIANSAIISEKLADLAVTLSKLADNAVDATKIAEGAVTEEKLVDGAVTGTKITDNAVSTEKLSANAVTADKIAANAITAVKINAGAITTDKIGALAVSADKIAANAVTAQKIAAGAVETDKLAANSVVADKIATNAITTGKINAGAITAQKIATGTITTDLISTAGLDAGVIKFGTMSGERIQAGTITANQLGANSVTASKISASAVTSAKIDAGAVTASKISVNSLSAISANLGTINAGTINGVNINGSTITQTSSSGSITLNNTGLTVSSNSGAKILMTIANLGGNEGDDLGVTFIDQTGNVGMEIYDYYTDSVIRTPRRLNFVGGTLGIGIDGTGATVPDFGTSVDGGLFINASGFASNTGVGLPGRNIISMLDDTMTVYANRANGEAFQVRSHSNGSSLRNDFIITALGNVQCPGAYSSTTSSAANVQINSNGTLRRSTSAKKYKQDIKAIDMSGGYADRLLNLYPKSWYDKAEVAENNGSTDGLKRHHGLIAEDVEAAGLSEYVTYEDGEIESIQYDRLWTPLIPIVRDNKDQINWLKIEIEYLKRKVKQLEDEKDE